MVREKHTKGTVPLVSLSCATVPDAREGDPRSRIAPVMVPMDGASHAAARTTSRMRAAPTRRVAPADSAGTRQSTKRLS